MATLIRTDKLGTKQDIDYHLAYTVKVSEMFEVFDVVQVGEEQTDEGVEVEVQFYKEKKKFRAPEKTMSNGTDEESDVDRLNAAALDKKVRQSLNGIAEVTPGLGQRRFPYRKLKDREVSVEGLPAEVNLTNLHNMGTERLPWVCEPDPNNEEAGMGLWLEEARGDTERLRVKLQKKDQRILELEARPDDNINVDEPPRKKARHPMYDPKFPWSTLAPSTIRGKKADLRKKYLKESFKKLPENVIRVDLSGHRVPKTVMVIGPLADRPVTGRGYRHQPDETKHLVRWCVCFKGQSSLSYVWWHELHIKFVKIIPPLGWLQEEKRAQNNFIPYQMEENGRDGNAAYRSVNGIIEQHLMMPEDRDFLEWDESEVGFRYELDGLCGVQVRAGWPVWGSGTSWMACMGFRYGLDGRPQAKNHFKLLLQGQVAVKLWEYGRPFNHIIPTNKGVVMKLPQWEVLDSRKNTVNYILDAIAKGKMPLDLEVIEAIPM
ncbi:Hypp6908 [Branchiostoma lanceolatum]|uniref:Hypp6908 protein n=1 Tax=Branchiostoma lanceolatum TaxID=7740 RepID=A0A8K0E5D0_BRALA|nr:Hypp6908 [Branchiostoma lanceolatum]